MLQIDSVRPHPFHLPPPSPRVEQESDQRSIPSIIEIRTLADLQKPRQVLLSKDRYGRVRDLGGLAAFHGMVGYLGQFCGSSEP